MKNMEKNTVRRSIALPGELVDELRAVGPPELRDNFNRLVTFILVDFTKRQKAYQFAPFLNLYLKSWIELHYMVW